MFSVSSPLLTSHNTPTRVVKGASPSVHQQREGALFNAIVRDANPLQKQIIESIPICITMLSPEVIPVNDRTGFFPSVTVLNSGVQYQFKNNLCLPIANEKAKIKGLLVAVESDLHKVRPITDLEQTKTIIDSPELQQKLDSIRIELATDLAKGERTTSYTVENKADLLRFIQGVVLGCGEPWSPANEGRVQRKIKEYFPFLEN